jgi:5-methylcytosine-specific restriction protein A
MTQALDPVGLGAFPFERVHSGLLYFGGNMAPTYKKGSVRQLSELEKLKPRKKERVIELVQAAGIDVSDWANFKGGMERAATNPKYCYEWSFVEPGRIVILNLWYASMEERKGTVSIDLNLRRSASHFSKLPGGGVLVARAGKLDLAIQDAARNRLPIRVIVNDGKMRRHDDPKSEASKVKFRILDPVPWAVKSYNRDTGDCTLVRGAMVGRLVDQFSVPPDPDAPVDRTEVTGKKFVRDSAVRLRALERAKGKCEYCDEPGFTMANGDVYVETHHVIPLCEGGSDKDNNVAALCPNHHREAHYGSLASDIKQMLLMLRKESASR